MAAGYIYKIVNSVIGDIISGYNLKEFCKQHKLNYLSMNRVVIGRLSSYYGWRRI